MADRNKLKGDDGEARRLGKGRDTSRGHREQNGSEKAAANSQSRKETLTDATPKLIKKATSTPLSPALPVENPRSQAGPSVPTKPPHNSSKRLKDDSTEDDDSSESDEVQVSRTTHTHPHSSLVDRTKADQSLGTRPKASAVVRPPTAQGSTEPQAVVQDQKSPKTSSDSTSLHIRMPGMLRGPIVWKGQDLQPGVEVVALSSADIQDIKLAIAKFKAKGKPTGEISRDQFPLSAKLRNKLREASREVHNGRGFAVIRGLDKAKFDDVNTEDSTIAFAGIAAHVGPMKGVSTLSDGNLALDHIYDAVQRYGSERDMPPTKVPSGLCFHADRFSGDVLALYVRHPGNPNEGQQYVASFPTIYNQLLRESPRTLEVLRGNWPFMVKTKSDEPARPLSSPVMFLNGSHYPVCQLLLEPLFGSKQSPRPADAPNLSREQQDAEKLLQKLATQNRYELDHRKGDIQFINNLGLLHARADYNKTDSGPRYLLRMFLRDPEYAWQTPVEWKPYFDKHFSDPSAKATINHKDLNPRASVFLHG